MAGLTAATIAPLVRADSRTARVGFVEAGSRSANQHFLDAFRRGLHDLKYVEGQSIVIEDRWADGRPERFPSLIAELLRLNVDVLVVASTPGAGAAKKIARAIPVVFWGVSDPVGIGVVASLAHPGANITGVALGIEDGVAGKWLQMLGETVPNATQFGVLRNPAALGNERVKELRVAAATLKVVLHAFEVREATELEGAFATMARMRIGGLIVVADPLTLRYREAIVRLAAQARLPAVYGFGEFVRSGGLIAYGPRVQEQAYRAAAYVDRILKGADPASLPVEQPTTFELLINLRTARALGLTIPRSMLLRADQVIE